MSHATRENVKAAFFRCLEASTDKLRQGILKELETQTPEVASEVREMLAAHEDASFLDQAAQLEHDSAIFTIENSDSSVEGLFEQIGTQIGPYKIREQLGEGGMGVVYVAEQKKPVRRKVALKIIKPGMDSKQVIARFEAERQALAMMDHPSIAKVMDAGCTETGRPYFVMDLIRGIPITDYCDQMKMTTTQRLELFISVCHAVQHAHQKGIIHRDLKPSNVMVTEIDGRAVPKVIDFGVAKATSQQLTEQTIYTQLSQMIGTPMYMSPEQAGLSGVDVDTRSDVYSLGVMLYELISGNTPFDRDELRSAGIEEMRRILQEVDPPRPSTRLSTLNAVDSSTISQQRGVDARRLQQIVHGELDWIVMRALDKDRNRRYDTASALALDVQRYLDDEPVEACPPSKAYRLQKFTKRNKAFLTTAAIVLIALVAGTGIASWQAVVANEERAQAQLAEEKAQTEKNKAVENLNLATAERDRAEENLRTAFDALDQYFETIVGDDRKWGKWGGHRTEYYQPLSENESKQLQASLMLYTHLADANGKDQDSIFRTGLAFNRIGTLYFSFRKDAEAYAAFKHAINLMGEVVSTEEQYFELLQMYTKIKNIATRNPGLNINRTELSDSQVIIRDRFLKLYPDSRKALIMKANLLATRGDSESATSIMQQAIEKDPIDPEAYYEASILLTSWENRPELALHYAQEAARLSPENNVFLAHMANYIYRIGKRDEAREISLQLTRRAPKYSMGFQLLSVYYLTEGDLKNAMEAAQKAVELNPSWENNFITRSKVYIVLGDLENGLIDLDQALALTPANIFFQTEKVKLLYRLGRDEEAAKVLTEIVPLKAGDYLRLARLYQHFKQWDKAQIECNNAIQLSPWLSGYHNLNAVLLLKLDDPATTLSLAIEKYPEQSVYHNRHADVLLKLDDPLTALSLAIEKFPEQNSYYCYRGREYTNRGEFDLALVDLDKAIELGTNDVGHFQAYDFRADLFVKMGQIDRALADFDKYIELSSDKRPAHFDRGEFYLYTMKNYEKALIDFNLALQGNTSQWWWYKRRGLTHFHLGHYQLALSDIAKALEFNSDDAPHILTFISPDLVANCPDQAFRDGILKLADKAIKNNADSFEILKVRIDIHESLGNSELAIADYNKIINLEPQQSSHFRYRGVAHRDRGEFDLALADLNKAVELLADDGDLEAYVSRAMLFVKMGQFDKAIADYDKYVELSSNSLYYYTSYQVALLSIAGKDMLRYQNECQTMLTNFAKSDEAIATHFTAWTCALAPNALEDYAPAIQLARHAVEKEPNNKQYLDGLGAILLRAGQYDAAKIELEKALAKGETESTSQSYIRYFLAIIEHHLGHQQAAEDHVQSANNDAAKELEDTENPPAWNRKLTLELLRKEAEALIQATSPQPEDEK